MILPIAALKEDALRVWNNTPRIDRSPGPVYSLAEQIGKEEELERLIRDVEEARLAAKAAAQKSPHHLIAARSRVQKSIVPLLHSFGCAIDGEMERSFCRVLDEFVHEACEFDPSIGEDAVYQASRNVMIMNTFQMLLGIEIALTPSVFAYSLLYPYTDNFLDAAEIDRSAKIEANAWLGRRLAGDGCRAGNRPRRTIDALVAMIEREFRRSACPAVYASLLAIHDAQTRSVLQQGVNGCLSAGDLLDVSIEKGGTSVLADGYLVAGWLAEKDRRFFFQFGVLLQLIDDLQDLEEDSAAGRQTLVGSEAVRGGLEGFTNRFLSFISRTLGPVRQRHRQLFKLIERSCRLLVLEGIAAHSACYGREYLATMERQSPVRFACLRAVKSRLQNNAAAR